MSDKSGRGPADRSRIALGEDDEIADGIGAPGLTDDGLREIVGRVDENAEAVRKARIAA